MQNSCGVYLCVIIYVANLMFINGGRRDHTSSMVGRSSTGREIELVLGHVSLKISSSQYPRRSPILEGLQGAKQDRNTPFISFLIFMRNPW